jgi:hypothetical protein
MALPPKPKIVPGSKITDYYWDEGGKSWQPVIRIAKAPAPMPTPGLSPAGSFLGALMLLGLGIMALGKAGKLK